MAMSQRYIQGQQSTWNTPLYGKGVPRQNSSRRQNPQPSRFPRSQPDSHNRSQPYFPTYNENVPEVNEHLIRWLALHRQRLADCGQDLDAQNLSPESVEVTATGLPPPFAWTVAATMLLERMYYGAVHVFGDNGDGEGYLLAPNAISTLQRWTDYALQHNVKVAYSLERKREAETAAQKFYEAVKQAGLKVVAFQHMWEQSHLVEEQLREKFHLQAPRTYSVSQNAAIQGQSLLKPTASPFRPRNVASEKNNHSPKESVDPFKQRLDEYFDDSPVIGSISRVYSDEDIEKIVALLRTIDNGTWRENPRLYIVLRRLGLLKLRKPIIEDRKITDASFPFSRLELAGLMNEDQQSSFLQMQNCILTQSAAAMKCENGGHAHFANEDQIPFQQDGILGTGGFAQVEKVTSKMTGRTFARKLLHRRALVRSHGSLHYFDNELKILRKLRHKHVVQIVGSYTEPQYVAMIISPVAEYDLHSYMEHGPNIEGFLPVLRTFPGCLATALEYLHLQGIRHKDIKPRNILVNGCNILFTDFGISRDCDDTKNATTSGNPGVFTPRYSAPEVIEYGKRSFPSDLWSLGCVFLEIFTVIQDIALSDMGSYFQNNGTKSKAYCHNQKAILGWISHLQHAQVDEENDEGPTQWITQLLQLDSTKRPTAGILADRIANHVSVTGRTGEFCGICCRYEHCGVDNPE